MVLHLVDNNGPQKWTIIAEHLPGRIGKQCRERWHNHLNPKIKKVGWSKEEEWILYLMHRNNGNKWAEIAKVLEGRTDNTIKNHWNSSMKKKLPEMARSFELYVRENIAKKLNVSDMFSFRLDGAEAERTGARVMREDLLANLLKKYIDEVERQNKDYFESKARELLEMRKQDPVSLIMANLLFKSLNISIEQYILKLQKTGGLATLSSLKEQKPETCNLGKENTASVLNLQAANSQQNGKGNN